MGEATDRDFDLRDDLETAADRSHLIGLLRRMASGVPNSRPAALARSLALATKHSFLYRWLTKEPEPEVIVIDLRETYAVGPVIAILDRLVEWLAPIWQNSRLERAIDGLVAIVEAGARTKTGNAIAKLVEPPEPPDGDRAPRSRDDRTDEGKP